MTFFNRNYFQQFVLYSYWLGSRTTAVLFDPRTDLLPKAADWGQHICSRIKQNCCCPRSRFLTKCNLDTFLYVSRNLWAIFFLTILLPLLTRGGQGLTVTRVLCMRGVWMNPKALVRHLCQQIFSQLSKNIWLWGGDLGHFQYNFQIV